MSDGRVIAGIVFVVGLLALAAYFYFDHIKHGRAEARGARRPVERLPLFGTDLLVTEGSAEADAPPRRRVPPPNRPAPSPTAGTPNGSGSAPAFAAGFAPAPAAAPPPATSPRPAAPTPPYRPAPPRTQPAAAELDHGTTGPMPAMPEIPSDTAPDPVSAAALAATGTHRAVSAPPATRPSPLNAQLHDGETLRFSIPDEGTLQFLPGRLEVVAGPDAGREIRFVRTPGMDPPRVTFGRSEGPAYGHVQLFARTVSRQHACMTLSDEHWELQNVSATNPVVLNARPLAPGEIAPLLVEGDRIEMGEVVFLFHER